MAVDSPGNIDVDLDIVRGAGFLQLVERMDHRLIRWTIFSFLCRGIQEGIPGCSSPPIRNSFPSPFDKLGTSGIEFEFHALSIFASLQNFGHSPPLLSTLPFLFLETFHGLSAFFILCDVG
jgi:hypothetical protein